MNKFEQITAATGIQFICDEWVDCVTIMLNRDIIFLTTAEPKNADIHFLPGRYEIWIRKSICAFASDYLTLAPKNGMIYCVRAVPDLPDLVFHDTCVISSCFEDLTTSYALLIKKKEYKGGWISMEYHKRIYDAKMLTFLANDLKRRADWRMRAMGLK